MQLSRRRFFNDTAHQSIVREIARVDGALIALSDAAGGGLVVSVLFSRVKSGVMPPPVSVI
ncbi:hypothetical protein PQQ52_26480 [Paraburkholderia sediminicola]|uniref:hypothetical protein n=1 Tax=Paraburkholderia sediminicola TaxID=458836 RepID=UPI0038B9F4B1